MDLRRRLSDLGAARNEIHGPPTSVLLDLCNWENAGFDEQKCALNGYNGKTRPISLFNFVHFEAV